MAAQEVWGDEHEIAAFCDINAFCQQILRKHWPKATIYGDIRTIKGGELGAVDLVTGGFPCQPFSQAGKRRSKEDDRYLWPEMLRVIRETCPSWIIGENVAGIINLALEDVCASLERAGYEVQPFIIPACAVAAPHQRKRVWIIAHANSERGGGRTGKKRCVRERQLVQTKQKGHTVRGKSKRCFSGSWFEIASRFSGMDDGIPDRLDRVRSLGNAIVSQVVVEIMQAIRVLEAGH